jgi:glycosyltransferase involved in cell wall biosynthesis
MKRTTILIPTYNRPAALAVTLTSLCYQTDADFEVVISDQSSDLDIEKDASVQAVIHLLRVRGHRVRVFRNLPARGIAQQRQFLLEQCDTPYCLYLDDDLILEPYVLGNLRRVLQQEGIGFTANAVIGLSYRDDHRPHQQHIEFWDGPVQLEVVRPRSPEWHRYPLHNAANLWHVQQRYGITPDAPRTYKVAWAGGCVFYDTAKLREVGGFSFWEALPASHCGEDVLVQLRMMKKYGGCGVLPSGVYHQELKTTVPDREINAPEYLEI